MTGPTDERPVAGGMDLIVTGEVLHWRGPAPHHFVAVPEEECALIRQVAAAVTYGWGMIPVSGRVGETSFTTSLYPKDGGYLLPLKDTIRAAEGIEVDDTVTACLTIAIQP